MRRVIVLLCAGLGCAGNRPDAEERRLLLVTIDGTRWQEVFRGPDEELLRAAIGTAPNDRVRYPLWHEDPGERRRALMPFLWGTLVPRGQIFGNRDEGASLSVSNPYRTSYPGYHELLCGFSSPFIVNNVRLANPDVTVLEWLNGKPGYVGRVAAFASWSLFPYIFNVERSRLPVDVGDGPDVPPLLERLRRQVAPPWMGSIYDAFTFEAARHHLLRRKPRVLFVGLGDTDEWAHGGRYDRYLESIFRADGWLRQLWETVEAMPEYRGRTSLLVTTDHGRGDEPGRWGQHSSSVTGAEQGWVAVMGSGTPARGQRLEPTPLTLAQVAATAGALLGEDYRAAAPAAAPALPLR